MAQRTVFCPGFLCSQEGSARTAQPSQPPGPQSFYRNGDERRAEQVCYRPSIRSPKLDLQPYPAIPFCSSRRRPPSCFLYDDGAADIPAAWVSLPWSLIWLYEGRYDNNMNTLKSQFEVFFWDFPHCYAAPQGS